MKTKFAIKWEQSFYADLQPDYKNTDDLIFQILSSADNRKDNLKKYHPSEINQGLRYLIINGYIRGTIIDEFNCSWSRITRKGTYYLELLAEFGK